MIYSDLVAAILAWVNRPEIEPSIPTFIALAEAQINRQLAENGVTGSVERATATLVGEYGVTPTDMNRPISLTLSTGERLENVTEQGMAAIQAECVNSIPGKPLYFTVVGDQFRLFPIPNGSFPATLIYEAVLTPLSDDNPSNWLLTAYPDAYLYGALVQSAPFLGDDARLNTWANLFTTALTAILTAERAKRGNQETRAFRPNMPHRHWRHR